MIDPTDAENAQRWLEEHAREHAHLYGDWLRKEKGVDKIEALLIKGLHNQGVPITIQKAHARADERYQTAVDQATEAKIKLILHEDLRDAKKLKISLYQSQVKDRL